NSPQEKVGAGPGGLVRFWAGGYFPLTNLLGVPSSGLPASGRHSTVSSILRARAKSRSVMPPDEGVFSFTQSLPHGTDRSAWCPAASHRKPTALTSMSVVGQPSVLYLRRSQPSSSRYHSGRPSSWILVFTSSGP